ncbi:MAG TPA: hypothetical protein VJP45_13095 [Candidatus Limnocylindria bacterium]|nr:hypothetical protein [Candidatus Limnocylindria bacterium]
MKPAQIAIGAVLALALAGGGFAAGMTVGRAGAAGDAGSSAAPTGPAGLRGAITGRLGQGGQGGGAGAQAVAGRILSVNDGSITIETRQPGAQGASPTVSSQIVLVGGSTRIVKTSETEIKLSDLKANDQVTIVGTTDASGNVSATAIVAGGNALQGILGGQGPGGGRVSPAPSSTQRP